MSVAESTVVADGWGWRFGANPSTSVDGVSFTIDAGERVLLLGPSGSGKSTLLRGIAGLLGDDEGVASGSLTVAGQDARAGLGRVGFVLQDPDTQAVLAKVGDDVAFGCENLGIPADEIWPRVERTLELVGLDLGLEHSTSALSGGQKQRLAIAGALAMAPNILLLDEPTANLDPAGVELVRVSVESAASNTGATVIIVEHRLDLWWDFATRVIVLGQAGTVIADGSPEQILSRAGAELERAGIWLPEFAAPPGFRAHAGSGLLEARGLDIGRRGQIPVRTGIDLTLDAGDFVSITGSNGSGKSTLALTLGGLLAPRGGELIATDTLARGVGPAPIRWTSRQLHSRIGNVFQTPAHQFVRATVLDELRLSATTAGLRSRDRDQAVDVMLERMALTSHENVNPFALSGGQQRRLSVATALIAQPQLVILDEPTFGQDAHTWRELVAVMGELCADGRAVVCMTHDAHLVAASGREIALEKTPADAGESA